MNLKIDLKTLAQAIDGKIINGDEKEKFSSFKTDTRNLKKGDFLWALRGKNFDAHDFLDSNAAKNSKGWIIEKRKVNDLENSPECVIAVDDTLKALHKLASFHRDKFNIPIIAVTGSNGKTTTKEMIFSILSEKGKTCSNKGNFNNQYGLPFSLLELDESHEYGVFELGASHKGDIAELGTIAKPTIAVITNISPAHLEFFGDIETVYKTKTELIDYISTDGFLIYNSDDARLARLKNLPRNKLSFGMKNDADIKAKTGGETLNISKKEPNKNIFIKLPVSGLHNYMNAAAAAAAASAIGFSMETIKQGLETFTPAPMRMQIFKKGKLTIIFDAYNANPESMRASIAALKSDYPRPHYLILGDMKELGKYSAEYHAELGKLLAKMETDFIFLAGPEMEAAHKEALKQGLSAKIAYSKNFSQWIDKAKNILKKGEGTVLIKASRAMNFEKIMKQISPE